jgi:hypothetical protein
MVRPADPAVASRPMSIRPPAPAEAHGDLGAMEETEDVLLEGDRAFAPGMVLVGAAVAAALAVVFDLRRSPADLAVTAEAA